jgi:hypothetical protein
MRCALVFICIIIDLHLITLICTKLFSNSSYITIKCMFSIGSEVAIACGEVKRGTVRFVFGTRSNFSPHFHFLILKLFIRCLLVGVREGLGGWDQLIL